MDDNVSIYNFYLSQELPRVLYPAIDEIKLVDILEKNNRDMYFTFFVKFNKEWLDERTNEDFVSKEHLPSIMKGNLITLLSDYEYNTMLKTIKDLILMLEVKRVPNVFLILKIF
jgi:hypothetical protein